MTTINTSATTTASLTGPIPPASSIATPTVAATALSRAEIGAMIKAQIMQVTPINYSSDHNSTAPAASTLPLSSSPLINAALVYTPISLQESALQQAAQFQPNMSTTVHTVDSILLATINQQYQVLAKIEDNCFTFMSSLPLRAGDSIFIQKINAQLWQGLTQDRNNLNATAFLPAFIAKMQASPNYLQLAWQLYRINLPIPNAAESTPNELLKMATPPSLLLQSLQTPLKQFFQTLLSVQTLQANINASAQEPDLAPAIGQDNNKFAATNSTQLVNLIKTSINNSGLIFEHKLAAFSQLSTNEQKQLLKLWQQGSTVRQDINFVQDQKTALVKLFAALATAQPGLAAADTPTIETTTDWLTHFKKLLPAFSTLLTSNSVSPNLEDTEHPREVQHTLWQNFFFPTTHGLTTANDKENLSTMVIQLLEQIKQQINRTHVQQLQSLLPSGENNPSGNEGMFSFCFDLPLLTNMGYERVPIWIEGYRENKSKKNKPSSQWRVVLAFELPELGKIIADCRLTPSETKVSLQKNALNMQFFSETHSTNQCIDQQISKLTKSLNDMGLEVNSHACRSPLPPLGDQRFQHDWVHLQI